MLAHTRACLHTKLYLLKTHDCSYKNISACKFQACLHTRPVLPWTQNCCDESSSRTNFPVFLLLPVFFWGGHQVMIMDDVNYALYLSKQSFKACEESPVLNRATNCISLQVCNALTCLRARTHTHTMHIRARFC